MLHSGVFFQGENIMTTALLHHPFDPVFDARSQILILGSFPSVKSREAAFYYGHPRNRFWPLLAEIFRENIENGIVCKTDFLLRHRIALWDVAASCRICGSSDSSLTEAAPNDLCSLVSKLPAERILLNGQTAGKLYKRFFDGRIFLPALILPSTSPANAAWNFEQLYSVWEPAIIRG